MVKLLISIPSHSGGVARGDDDEDGQCDDGMPT